MKKLIFGLTLLASIASFAEPISQPEELSVKTYKLNLGQGVGFNLIHDDSRKGLTWVICSTFNVRFRGYGKYSLGSFYGGAESSMTFTNRNPFLLGDDGEAVADIVSVVCNHIPSEHDRS